MLRSPSLGPLLALLLLTTSCAGLRRAAVSTTAPIISMASEEIETESNWELFRTGVPGNLKLLEGFLHVSPEDDRLLASVIKAYVGYAFAVHETLYLEDQLARRSTSEHRDQALQFYSKAVRYGWDFFEREGMNPKELAKRMRSGELEDYLNEHLKKGKKSHREIALFTAQALGSLINLQREDMVLVTQLPIAKGLFDWVCAEEPGIQFGACALFFGAYEAGRPAMLGGNPTRGKEIFEQAIADYPENWLAPASLLQFYALPQYDEDVWKQWRPVFEQRLKEFEQRKYWSPLEESAGKSRLSLYQSIALKRYQIMKKYEKSLF